MDGSARRRAWPAATVRSPQALEHEVVELTVPGQIGCRVDAVTGESRPGAQPDRLPGQLAHSGTAPVPMATTSMMMLTSQAQPIRWRM